MDHTHAAECLARQGWTPEQAAGAIAEMDLPPWRPGIEWRSDLLKDWCSGRGKDHSTLEAQLGFLDYELRNAMWQIGAKLDEAKTKEEATAAVRPYAEKLRNPPYAARLGDKNWQN